MITMGVNMNGTPRELTDAELELVAAAGIGRILLTGAECAVAGAAVGGLPGALLGGGLGLLYGIFSD
jgi:hypothetical protein